MLTQGLPRFGACIGQVHRGQVRLGQVRLGPVRLGQVTALCLALLPLAAATAQAQATAAEAQAAVTPAAVSQPAAPPLRVELNKLETAGETCKAMLIVENGKGGPIRSLRLDLYAFDQDGIVQKRSMVELGPVPARKTALRQFEIAPTPCTQVGRVLLNDVAACDGQDLTRESCLERIEPSSAKGAAPFVR